MRVYNAFDLPAGELQAHLSTEKALFPELEAARNTLEALKNAPQTQHVLARTSALMEDLSSFPSTSYTRYRQFVRRGERGTYETPYFQKREALAGAALRLFLGDAAYKDPVQDYLWSICEESNWVLPAHENVLIDLFAAETGFVLAEALTLLGDTLDDEVRQRVRTEVEHRIFEPYLRFHGLHHWYKGSHNWNGVCNSSVAATFLLLCPEPRLTARALELALAGLKVFIDRAFEDDGSSTEGVAYWHYGLINFIALSEMLRAKSGGKLELLAAEKFRAIAAYPAKMHLSGAHFAAFSDCDETIGFNPGILQRLSERTAEPSLLELLSSRADLSGDWRLGMMLRNILWWDGKHHDGHAPEDAQLPVGGAVRLVGKRSDPEAPLIVAIKAGHNAEHHNQNDVGSFIVHVAGENLLTDPGRGLYSRDYFGPERYENIFASSYGHSVPRIGGELQQAGLEFAGELLDVTLEGARKSVLLELAGTYDVANLKSAQRQLTLEADETLVFEDTFAFEGEPTVVEEAFVTWSEVEIGGAEALIHGERHTLRLSIETPQGAEFHLRRLEDASRQNQKPEVLKRLSLRLPRDSEVTARLRMHLLER